MKIYITLCALWLIGLYFASWFLNEVEMPRWQHFYFYMVMTMGLVMSGIWLMVLQTKRVVEQEPFPWEKKQ